jgi:hypothetical protein
MDRACEGDATRQLALDLGFFPVGRPSGIGSQPGSTIVPRTPWHNEIARLSRRLKGFRRTFSRFEKVEAMFVAFIYFAPRRWAT